MKQRKTSIGETNRQTGPFCIPTAAKTDKHGLAMFCSQVESTQVFSTHDHLCSLSQRGVLCLSSHATQQTPCVTDLTHRCSFEGFMDKLTCVSLEHIETWSWSTSL